MKLYELLLPFIQYTATEHQTWSQKIEKEFGGYTFRPVEYKGRWMSENKQMTPVRVACDPVDIHSILELTKDHFKLEKVLAYEVSGHFLFSGQYEDEL
jgi:hypothetical protein